MICVGASARQSFFDCRSLVMSNFLKQFVRNIEVRRLVGIHVNVTCRSCNFSFNKQHYSLNLFKYSSKLFLLKHYVEKIVAAFLSGCTLINLNSKYVFMHNSSLSIQLNSSSARSTNLKKKTKTNGRGRKKNFYSTNHFVFFFRSVEWKVELTNLLCSI